jgi:hypothetical protein
MVWCAEKKKGGNIFLQSLNSDTVCIPSLQNRHLCTAQHQYNPGTTLLQFLGMKFETSHKLVYVLQGMLTGRRESLPVVFTEYGMYHFLPQINY